jgi:hypothetical protein
MAAVPPPVFLQRMRKSILVPAPIRLHHVIELAGLFPEWKVITLTGGMSPNAPPSMLRTASTSQLPPPVAEACPEKVSVYVSEMAPLKGTEMLAPGMSSKVVEVVLKFESAIVVKTALVVPPLELTAAASAGEIEAAR